MFILKPTCLNYKRSCFFWEKV